MASTNEKGKENTFLVRLNAFLHKNRYILAGVLVFILLFFIGYIVTTESTSRKAEKSALLSEEMQDLFLEWLQAEDPETKNLKEESIVSQGEDIISRFPKQYSAQRARFILGELYFEKMEWESSAKHYTTLADSFPKSYLTSVSLMNAAAAWEEAGETEKAVELYKRVANDLLDTYPDVPRALFSLGRIHESLSRFDEALDAYNSCLDRFPESSWTKLAKNRIIHLNSQKR